MDTAMYIIGVYNGRAMAGSPATIEECIATMLVMVFLLLFLELPRFLEVRKEQRQRVLRWEEEEKERQRLKKRLAGFEAWRNRKLAEEKIQQGELGSAPTRKNATEQVACQTEDAPYKK